MTDLKNGINNGDMDIALGTLTSKDEISFSFASSSYEQLCLAVPLSHPTSASAKFYRCIF